MFNSIDKKVCYEQEVDMESQLSQITESRVEEDELVHVQGTVIHHFVFAVRQDVALAKELLGVLRIRQCALSTFEVALLMALVRLDRYAVKSSEILRKAFLQDFAHDHKIKTSAWVSTIDDLSAPSDMRQHAACVMRRSAKGWDHVLPGLVTFAMSNIEWAAKKCSTGGGFGKPAGDCGVVDVPARGRPADPGGGGTGSVVSSGAIAGVASTAADLQRSVASQLVQFCSEILEKVFRYHTSVRDEILGQILARVLTRDDSVKYVVQLLARITKRCSKDVIDCLPKIKESLEYLAFMPPTTAVALIRALSPVLRLSESLLDYVIIILRKALFSREEDARVVALQCFFLLAQGEFGMARKGDAAHGDEGQVQDALALEIIGQLRRTMVQQVYIRERFYDGLCDVVRAKSYLIDDVAAVLYPQLQRYCLTDGTGTRIQLEKCVDGQNKIVEPIGKLLRAIAVCVALKTNLSTAAATIEGNVGECDNGKEVAVEEEDGIIGAARNLLDKLAVWISDVDPEDFDMDKETDFTSTETHHLSCARLLVGCYEVLFEHSMLRPHFKIGHENRLFRGVRKLHGLLDLVAIAKPAAKGGGNKGRKGSSLLDDRASLLSYDFERRLLLAVDAASSRTFAAGDRVDLCQEDSGRALRKAVFDDDNVISLALETAQRQLLEAGRSISNTVMQCEDLMGHRNHIIRLAPLLLRQFYSNLQSKRVATTSGHAQLFKGKKVVVDKDCGIELALVALHGLEICVQLACGLLSSTELCDMIDGLNQEFESMQAKHNVATAGFLGGDAGSGMKDGNAVLENVLDKRLDKGVSQSIKSLQNLCNQLLQDEEPDYAAAVAETIYVLQGSLSLKALVCEEKWVQDMCKRPLPCGSDHPPLAKALLANLLRTCQCEEGLETLIAIGKDMQILFREEEDQIGHIQRSPEYDIVREDTRDLLFSVTTDAIKGCCEDIEWVWDSVELNARPDLTDNDDKKDSPDVEAMVLRMNQVEDETLRRLTRAVEALLPLSRCLESEYANKESVIKALTRLYRAAEHVAKKVEQRRGVGVRKAFETLMMRIGTQLNDALYDLLLRFDVKDEERARGKRKKISNESRLVPALVYQVELLEAHLIKIHKAQGNTKAVDFIKHFKRSTARDFKIDYGVLDKLARAEDEEEHGKKKSKGGKKRKEDAENSSVNSSASKHCRRA